MNALQILSDLIQVVSDVANTCSNPIHPGVAVPIQASAFTGQKSSANGLKSTLDPVVV